MIFSDNSTRAGWCSKPLRQHKLSLDAKASMSVRQLLSRLPGPASSATSGARRRCRPPQGCCVSAGQRRGPALVVHQRVPLCWPRPLLLLVRAAILPLRPRRGECICLRVGFVELPKARTAHHFMQVHIDIVAGRVWLVPTRKTATAETAARNFVSSLFRDVGCPTCSSRTAERTL